MSSKFTLILNTHYEPIRIVNWRCAVRLLFSKEEVEVLEEYEELARSPSIQINIPAVMKLNTNKGIQWTKRNRDFKSFRPRKIHIYQREDGKCYYCDRELEVSEATLDHIVPRSKGGTNTWENLVLCCFDCNSKKSNKKITDFTKTYNLTPKKIEDLKKSVSSNKMLKHNIMNFPVEWLNYIAKKG